MMYDKPRIITHMDGDTFTGYTRNLEVRCIIELDDDESFCHKKTKRQSPTRECPAMRERLARHMKQCPSQSNKRSSKSSSRLGSKCSTDSQTMQLNKQASKKVMNKEILTDFYEKSLALSPIISMDDKLYNPCYQQSNSKSAPAIENSVETNTENSLEELILRNKSHNTQDLKDNRNDIKVKQTETVILHPKGKYKDNLQTIIMQWLSEIPVFPHVDEASKIIRDNAVNELHETIFNLSVDINNDHYEENVKTVIHSFIKHLPIWYPCSSKVQIGYKKDLENSLFERIKTLNNELFNSSNDKKTYVRNCIHRNTPKPDSANKFDAEMEKSSIDYFATKSAINESCSPIFLPRDRLSKSVLVFVSDHDLSGPGPSLYPVASTPKKPSPEMEVSKFNEQEKKYLEELSKLINDWLETVPELSHVNKDKNYKEVMVFDLAGHLIDEMKLEQYSPDKNYLGTRDNLIRCAVLSWIIKFEEDAFQNIVTDKETSDKYLDYFYSKFSKIPIPVLTKSHRDIGQDQNASKCISNESRKNVELIPEGKERKRWIKNENLNESINKHANNNTKKRDLNKTLLELIERFIEHNYEEGDILVKGALSELLKSEFRRLSPSEKMGMYQNCGQQCSSKEMLPGRLKRELYYIKDISDWLKNMPIEKSFNVSGNPERIEFVTNLAKDICAVEMKRIQAPKAMSYDNYLVELIRNHIQNLPFLPNEQATHHNLIELYAKILSSRKVLNENDYLNNTSETVGQTIGEFIDEYIRINGKDIADDQVKLEVWNARILQEILQMLQTSEPITSFKEKAYERLSNVPIPGDDTVLGFNRKLMYAHEIGDWIKNMPLQAISDEETTDMMTKMISNLADELSKKHVSNILDDPELKEYVMNWILTLPLEPAKEIDVSVLIQQLSKRIKRINDGKYQSLNDSSIVENHASISKPKRLTVSTGRSKVHCSGKLIIDTIEDWCNKLPIKEQDQNREMQIKDDIAIKLFKKVGDYNVDPKLNDDILYQDLLSDEIDTIFKDLNQYDEIKRNEDNLKFKLLNSIVGAKLMIKEKAAGEHYKQKLKNTIEASLPVPITHRKIYDPGFEIYKNKLTNMFILQNFDYSDDQVKLKYEVKLKDAIDNYFQEAQKRNAVPLGREDIYNELFTAMFKVPIPNETSVIQEVEEVKLRCEIDGWFEGLPIREAINLNEQLDWNKILEMLAKRIYEIESNDLQPGDNIHKEITKWLVQLPLLPGEERNIEMHAKTLENRLKLSKNDRKCVRRSLKGEVARKGKCLKKIPKNKNVSLDRNQVAGPSGANQTLSSPPRCVAASTPRKKPGDLVIEIVENWCWSLPLSDIEGENYRPIRDDLMTKILKKLSGLDTDPRVFDDDMLYDKYLDNELERLIRTLPMCCELQRSKDVRKQELISAVRSIRPLIRNERARYDYKKKIKNTIKKMLPVPLNTTEVKVAVFNDLVNGIADSFVQYNYNKDDYEGKQEYKSKIRDAIIKYYSEINDQSNEDTLIKQNKLICELVKIPVLSEAAIKEDVEEIKMKDEVSNFLNEVIPDDNNVVVAQKEHIKSNLSRRLHDLEKSGHSCENDRSMMEEIVKSLNKANQDVDITKVEEFVKQLKENEAIRKSPPIRKPEEFQTNMDISQELKQHGWSGYTYDSAIDQPPKPLAQHQYKSPNEKFYTLLPESHRNPSSSSQIPAKQLQLGQSYTYQSSAQNLHPPPSTGPVIHYPSGSKEPSFSYQTLPEIPELRPPSEMFQSFREPRPTINNSGQSSVRPPPGIDSRFPPRLQTRRQSLDSPSNQIIYGAQRRQSLQSPLKYDYNFHDNKNAQPTYKEVCVEPSQSANNHNPLPVLPFDDAPKTVPRDISQTKPRPKTPTQNRPTLSSHRPVLPTQRQPLPLTSLNPSLSRPSTLIQGQAASIRNTSLFQPGSPAQSSNLPRPLSPVQIQPTSSVNPTLRSNPPAQFQPVSQPSPQLASLFQPSTLAPSEQQSSNVLSAQNDMTPSRPMTTQSYQGFQNAVAAVSSPVQIQSQADNTPITLPQSTEDGPNQDPEDVPTEGTYRMAATPRTLRNPPSKRQRIRSSEEDVCECLGGNRRCTPFPGFPFWCYMPYRYPRFCFL